MSQTGRPSGRPFSFWRLCVPTGYTPIYRIEKGGIDITDRFNDRTTQIKVELQAGGGNDDQCTITLDDRDWAIARPIPGRDHRRSGSATRSSGSPTWVRSRSTTSLFIGTPRSIMLVGTSTGSTTFRRLRPSRSSTTSRSATFSARWPARPGSQPAIGWRPGRHHHPVQEPGHQQPPHDPRAGAPVRRRGEGRRRQADVRQARRTHDGERHRAADARPASRSTSAPGASSYSSRPGVRFGARHRGGTTRTWSASGSITPLAGSELGGQVFGGPFNSARSSTRRRKRSWQRKSKMEALKRAEVTGRLRSRQGRSLDQGSADDPRDRNARRHRRLVRRRQGDPHVHQKHRHQDRRWNARLRATGDNFEQASKEFWRPIGRTVGESSGSGTASCQTTSTSRAATL